MYYCNKKKIVEFGIYCYLTKLKLTTFLFRKGNSTTFSAINEVLYLKNKTIE